MIPEWLARKSVLASAELKVSGGDGPGTVEGYASVFRSGEQQDSGGDQIVVGAFAKSLPYTLDEGFMALGHDWDRKIGTFDELREDPHGLYFAGTFHSTPDAQNARTEMRERMERGKKVALSIGYVPEETDFLPNSGIRQIKALKLYEVSYVPVGMDDQAATLGVKGLSLADELDRLLIQLAQTKSRITDVLALRAKDGRTLSARNRETLSKLHGALSSLDEHRTALKDLLDATDPDAQKALALSIWLEHQQIEAQLNGLKRAA